MGKVRHREVVDQDESVEGGFAESVLLRAALPSLAAKARGSACPLPSALGVASRWRAECVDASVRVRACTQGSVLSSRAAETFCSFARLQHPAPPYSGNVY